jgi:hypothetical protein
MKVTVVDRVELYWLPLGAGGHVVRWNGRAYEALSARAARRPVRDLYHAALVVTMEGTPYAIEMAPAWHADARQGGSLRQGPVGAAWLGRSIWFRYEVRCRRAGRIPDIDEAVASPQRLAVTAQAAQRVLALVPHVPLSTWGRDEHRIGDMWNSNSVVSWLLVTSGIGVHDVTLPPNGRAPGWTAGCAVACLPSSMWTATKATLTTSR